MENKDRVLAQKRDLDATRLKCALYLASLEKGIARQLFDAAMAWKPIREMVEKSAKGEV